MSQLLVLLVIAGPLQSGPINLNGLCLAALHPPKATEGILPAAVAYVIPWLKLEGVAVGGAVNTWLNHRVLPLLNH